MEDSSLDGELVITKQTCATLVRVALCTYWTAKYIIHFIQTFLLQLLYLLRYLFINTEHKMSPMSGKLENVEIAEVADEQDDAHCDQALDGFGDLPGASDASLGEFFSRPVKIYDADWLPTANIFEMIDPWKLFFSNPRIENRLTNFKLLRANLRVKVVMNGNSFYQGRLMISYNPLAADDEYFSNAPHWGYNIRLYQRQKIMCDPCQSTGGEMKLPFIWYNDYLDVVNLHQQLELMGSLTLRTLSPLRLSTESAPTTGVSISIFAWAEDVVVGGLTATDMKGLSPQAGSSDEYAGGPISNLMATVRNIASPLTSVPYIGSYARATEIASGAIGSIAKLFGFSKPNDLEEPNRMQPRPIYSLATTEGQDGSLKLTLDPKQEVSIDPKLWNCDGKDCLAINNIASVDSLYASFEWNGSDDRDHRLFSTLVDPCVNHSTNGKIYMPACCGVTLPFDFWTGSLELTFEVVASAFHRGRLGVVYDPHQASPTYEANTAYQQIIDISEHRKFTIRVGPSQAQALRKHYIPGVYGSDQDFPLAYGGHSDMIPITSANINPGAVDSSDVVLSNGIGNGVISVYVINRLVALNSATVPKVDILVSIKACEDFRLFVPNNRLNSYCYTLPPEEDAQIVPMGGIEPAPTGVIDSWPTFDVSVKGRLSEAPNIYVGEQIFSIRSLLKRYTPYLFNDPIPIGYVTGDLAKLSHALYPLMFMYGRHVVHKTLGSIPPDINYVGHSYISYFRPAFAVLRGSTRWKYVPTESSSSVPAGQISVNRVANTGYLAPALIDIQPGANRKPRTGLIAFQEAMAGQAITEVGVNATLEFEVPFYSNRRFVPGSSGRDTKDCAFADGFHIIGSHTALQNAFQMYVAAGEDLTMGYFFGFPPMLNLVAIPTAA